MALVLVPKAALAASIHTGGVGGDGLAVCVQGACTQLP